MSQLTTHILDTSAGKPAEGVSVVLEKNNSDSWERIADGITNHDGRIGNLLVSDQYLAEGNYRLVFDTGSYYTSRNQKSFYPKVTVEFTVSDHAHYHVPLLLNPFGYSTYRGS